MMDPSGFFCNTHTQTLHTLSCEPPTAHSFSSNTTAITVTIFTYKLPQIHVLQTGFTISQSFILYQYLRAQQYIDVKYPHNTFS